MHNVRKDELIYKASACNSLLHITNTIDKKAKANGKSNASLLIISRANIQVLNKKRKSKKKREKKVNDSQDSQKTQLINTENNTHLWNHTL